MVGHRVSATHFVTRVSMGFQLFGAGIVWRAGPPSTSCTRFKWIERSMRKVCDACVEYPATHAYLHDGHAGHIQTSMCRLICSGTNFMCLLEST